MINPKEYIEFRKATASRKKKVAGYRRKDGTRVKGYAIYTKGRRTPILVDGKLSKKDAIAKALSVQKRGSKNVDKIRRLTESEQKLADRGKWVKGHNIDKERKSLRGVGPKPSNFKSRNLKDYLEFRQKSEVRGHRRKNGVRVKPFFRKAIITTGAVTTAGITLRKVLEKKKLAASTTVTPSIVQAGGLATIPKPLPNFRDDLKRLTKEANSYRNKVGLKDSKVSSVDWHDIIHTVYEKEVGRGKGRLRTIRNPDGFINSINKRSRKLGLTKEERLLEVARAKKVIRNQNRKIENDVFQRQFQIENGDYDLAPDYLKRIAELSKTQNKLGTQRFVNKKKKDFGFKKPSQYLSFRIAQQAIEFKSGLKEALVKVKGFTRDGVRVKPFRRKTLLAKNPVQTTLGSVVGTEIKEAGKDFVSKGTLPSRTLTANLVKEGTIKGSLATLKDPVRTVQKGFQREQEVLSSLSSLVGRPVSKGEVISVGFKTGVGKIKQFENQFVETIKTNFASKPEQLVKNPRNFIQQELKDSFEALTEEGQVKELAVNLGGFVGGVAGAPLGPAGAIGGDLGGAVGVRKGLDDLKAVKNAYRELKGLPEFDEKSRIDKVSQLIEAAKSHAQKIQKEQGDTNLAGDLGGWAGGNAMSNLSPVKVPLIGSTVGIPASMISEDIQKIAKEENINFVESAQKYLATKIKEGDYREQKVRDSVKNKWNRLKRVVK